MVDFIKELFANLSQQIYAHISVTQLNFHLPSLTIPTLENFISSISSLFWKYLHLTPILFLIWPFVISLIFSLTSISTWVFWLLTSVVFGIIQLIYVLYQFMMISVDLGVLSLLKTYTSMRSFVRYYTLRSGIGSSNSRARRRKEGLFDDHVYNKRGRKREWRKKLDAAKSLNDFLQIEIQEPPMVESSLSSTSTSMSSSSGGSNVNNNSNSYNNDSSSSSSYSDKSTVGSIFRSTFLGSSNTSRSSLSPTSSPMRKIKSFHVSPSRMNSNNGTQSMSTINNNEHTPLSSNSMSNSSNNNSINNNTGTITSGFHRSLSNIEINNLQSSNHHLIPENQIDIEQELGMTGTMLLQTTYRLNEARMQATANYKTMSYLSSRKVNGNVNNMSTTSIHEAHDEDDDQHEDNNDNMDLSYSSSSILNLSNTSMLQQHYENNAASQLKFLLQGVVKRNHLSINDLLIQDALSVMESGRHHLTEQSRNVILNYHEEVEKCLKWIADCGLEKNHYHQNKVNASYSQQQTIQHSAGSGDDDNLFLDGGNNQHQISSSPNYLSGNSTIETPEIKLYKELTDRRNLIRKLKHNMGRTALMLSGGGAQAMYHLGTIKALCESKLYDDISVISGTSGGSISAGMCAIKTREELLADVCVPHVSTDYGLNGEMKKQNIRWFPTVLQMGEYWLKHKLLVDPHEFKRCCDFYFGDITFEEAFERTGKHVCITVSASRAKGGGGEGGGGAQRLLLNHISTPHVTIASAVAASCALPGVMAPAKLVTKNQDSAQEYFEVDGVEWIDGSVQADLPFKRISTLFNVSNYIVCQTNFHVLPFLHKAHHPNTKSFYWRAFQTCEWDIRNRVLNLSRLGLFPKIFGQDVSKVFKQKYHGDLTLVPKFTTMQIFGLQSLLNPTFEDMTLYLQNGQSSAWPYLSVIQEMLRLETAIDKCIKSLNERIDRLSPENDWDDVESITSATTSRFKTFSARRENELLKQKVHSLELENLEMKKQLELLQKKFGIQVNESTTLSPGAQLTSPAKQIEFVTCDQRRPSSSPQKRNEIKKRFWKKDQ